MVGGRVLSVKVLVTGAGGQVGCAIAAAAPEEVSVVALGRGELDITDTVAVAARVSAERPDWVINCAAYTAVDRAEEDFAAALRINGEAVGDLSRACRAIGAQLAHLSTDFVFPGDRTTPLRPDDATAPCNAYGRSKLAGEEAALASEGALVVRTAWVYAARGSNFVNTMLRLMRERDEVRVVDDQIGTPTHARSLARTIWALVQSGASGVWHATDAGMASWYDFAQAIHDEALALGLLERPVAILPIPTSAYPTAAVRPAFSVLDKRATWERTGRARHWRHELGAMLRELREAGHG
jgi:dTDP-4-dehydrorhamnose reductase